MGGGKENDPRAARGPHPVIGVTGLPASGKSAVAARFARYGARVIDADRVGHELLQTAPVREAIRRRFGPEVFGPDGSVLRPTLGRRVFADPAALADLEAILHPPMAEAIEAEVARLRREAPVVIDAALLHKMELAAACDAVVVVRADRETRRRRAAARGWTEEDLRRREARQSGGSFPAERAAYRIENNGTEDDLDKQTLTVWKELNDA